MEKGAESSSQPAAEGFEIAPNEKLHKKKLTGKRCGRRRARPTIEAQYMYIMLHREIRLVTGMTHFKKTSSVGGARVGRVLTTQIKTPNDVARKLCFVVLILIIAHWELIVCHRIALRL